MQQEDDKSQFASRKRKRARLFDSRCIIILSIKRAGWNERETGDGLKAIYHFRRRAGNSDATLVRDTGGSLGGSLLAPSFARGPIRKSSASLFCSGVGRGKRSPARARELAIKVIAI
jgi:hypothetical protein